MVSEPWDRGIRRGGGRRLWRHQAGCGDLTALPNWVHFRRGFHGELGHLPSGQHTENELERSTIWNGKTHYTWPFSIANGGLMVVYFFFFLCGLMGYEWDVSPLIGLTSFIYPMIWGFNVDLMGSHEHRKLLGGWIFPSDLHGDIWRHWWSGWKTMKMTSRQLSSLEWCWMEGDSSP